MLESITTIGRPAEAPTREEFRAMMGGFPTGVAIITTTDQAGRPWGMTCSSVCSVTLEPPTLLVCLRDESPTLAALQSRGRFAVNLLHDGGQPIAELFASGRPDRYDYVRWRLRADNAGPHLYDDAHAIADCRIRSLLPVGDHMVVFGEAYRVTRQPDLQPLLYGLRQYASWPTR
jgi:flavin reductase (DIM6/NTAB) family NADH-FMN oxidoreductase RutF